MKKILLGLLGALMVAGCATPASLDDTRIRAPGRVVWGVFDYPYKEVYKAARSSLSDLDLIIERENEAEGKIYAKSSPNMTKVIVYKTGFGEHVAVYVTDLGEQGAKVEIVTQKSNRLELGYKDYRNILLKLVHARLEGNKR